MKKQCILSIVLVLTFLLSMFMFCATAFATTATQDGVIADLTTDKESYAQGENVAISLVVKNTSPFVGKVWAKLVLPSGLKLTAGELDSGVFELDMNKDEQFRYEAAVPTQPTTTAPTTTQAPTTTVPPVTTEPVTTVPPTTTVPPVTTEPTVPATTVPGTTVAPTTQAPTTTPSGSGDNSDTGDISLYLYGAIAIFSLAALVILSGGFKGILKQRWFVLVLCAALLVSVAGPMIARATADQRTMEVKHTVTVDGETVEISAVITYDYDEEILPESEVKVKENGVSLYNLVAEKGWFTPCNKGITIDGITASHSVRPEVTASYIDMLFGCVSNKTGNFVKGEFDNAQIITEDAELELVVGVTEDKASHKALTLIEKDEWIITEVDGKLVVAGWFDNAIVEAARALYAKVDGQSDVTLDLPIKGSISGYTTDIPNVDNAVFAGGIDGSEGTLVLRYAVEDASAYQAYAAKLVSEGYTLYAENQIQNLGDVYNLFATYVKGTNAVHISYLPNALLEADYDSLTPNQQSNYDRSFRAIGNEMRVITDTTANLFTNAANNTYVDAGITPKVSVVNLWDQAADGNDNGECLIFTLADGSFIVADSGFAQDADQIYKALCELNERSDGKIIIVAWIMSHHHGDHIGGFKAMAEKEYAKNIIVEQFIFNPTATTYAWRSQNAPYNYSLDFNYNNYTHEYINSFLEKFGGDTKIVNPHMGQKMMIRNAEVEFMFTGDEDLYPVHIDNTNDSSLVYTVNFKGGEGEADSRVLMLNDACCDSMNHVLMPLFNASLDCDIVQVGHHGFGGPNSSLYRMMEPTVAIWCTTVETTTKLNHFPTDGSAFGGSAGYLVYRKADDTNAPVDLIIHADKYMHTLHLPFAFGDPVYKTGLGSYKSNFFQNSSIKLATLDVGGFGGDLEGCLAAVQEYLLAENADVLNLNNLSAAQAEAMANALGYPYFAYAPADDSVGNALLSRYPITDFDAFVAEGDAVGVALLDVEGITVDVAFMAVDAYGKTDNLSISAQGDYQIVMGVLNLNQIPDGVAVAVSGNTRENIIANTMLGAGVKFTDGKLEDAAEKTGVEALDKLVSANIILSRKHLDGDFEEGQFDDVPTVAVQYSNWRNILTEKAALLRWILQEKPEIMGLVAAPSEVMSDAGAAEFAQLAGYEYYAWIEVWKSSATECRGHLLLSHYPIEEGSLEVITLRADDGQMNSKAEGRAYMKVVVTMPDGEKVNVYLGENDPSGEPWIEHRTILENAVKANYAEDGRDFIIIGYKESHVSNTYADLPVKSYHSAGSPVAPCSIIVSGDYPMDGMRTYGTKAYPVDGRSPIGTTILNISPYAKVELADLPEYDLVVNNGSGTGAFQEGEEVYAMADAPGKGMVFTGWVAEGITLEDPMAMEQVFEMPATAVKLTATYKAVAYTERNEIGTSDEIKAAVLPAYRFQARFAKYQDGIIENLKNCGADVLVVSLVDYDKASGRNSVDVVPILREALKEIYPNSYYAPGYKTGTPASDDEGSGYVGHFVLSKYPILFSESVELNDEGTEIRNAGHIIVNVGTEAEPTRLGVYFTHMGAASNWTSGKQNLYDVITGANEDAFVMLGKAHYADAKATITEKLGATVATGNANLNIFGSANITLKADSYGTDSTIKDLLVSGGETNSSENLYYVTLTMPTYTDGDTKYPITVGDEVMGWYAANETVTLTAPAAPVGKHFNGWTLPEDLTLTEGSKETATIKFTMPAKALVLAQNYQDWPVGTVVFNANGGSGTMASVDANAGDFTLPANGFYSPAGKKFVGWGLKADATKTDAINTVVVTGDTTTTVYAIWEDTGSVSTAVVVANRFTNKYQNAADRAKIHEKLLTLDVDILAITQISESMTNPSAYDLSAMFTEISTALKEAYPYAYFAPAWYGAENKQGGSTGHMILSKYEMVGDGKTIVLLEGVPSGMTGSVEGRSAGKVTLNIRGVATDVFFMHTGHQDQWSILAPEIKKSENWIAIGYMNYANLNEAGVEGYLEQDISAAFPYKNVAGQTWNFVNIISNSAVSNADTDTALFTGYTTYAVYKATVAQPVASKTVTVTDGNGSGNYKPGATVTITANAAPDGKVFSYWDGLRGLTLTEGNAVSGTLKFTMPKSDVTVKAVYRNEGEIKTGMIPVGRFKDKYKNEADRTKIHNEILALDVDILALTQIGEGMTNPNWYDASKMATGVAEAVKHEYPYSYYAPAWFASNEAGSGSSGHLILSKFPIVDSETIVVVSGTPYGTAGGYTEGRSAGKVTLEIEGNLVDVYATHTGAKENWEILAPEVKESGNWIVLGYVNYANLNKAGVEAYLGESIYAGFADRDVAGQTWNHANILSDMVISNPYNDTTNLANYNAGYQLYLATITMPEAKTVTVTDGVGGGEYIPGNTVTLTANAAPEGKVFSYWDGLQGLTLTEGNAVSGTLKFTMPSSDVTVKAVYRNKGEIKTALVEAAKFGKDYKTATTAAQVNAGLLNLDVDILAVTQIEGGTIIYPSYNRVDVAGQITEALKHEYPYAYYAPAWYTIADDDGSCGHLILSKFEIKESETSVIVQGVPYTNNNGSYSGGSEGRAAGRVQVVADGCTVDVFFTHLNDSGNWSVLAPIVKASTADSWLIMGNVKHNSADISWFATQLGETVTGVRRYGEIHILASGNVSMVSNSYKAFGYGATQLLQGTVTLPEKQATVSFDANGGTGTMADAKAIGSYTLPENGFTAPKGHKFKGWATSADGEVISSLDVTADIKLYAIWEPTQLKIAVLPTFRFQKTYKANKSDIVANLKAQNADVFVFTNVDYDKTAGYNTNIDLVAEMIADLPEYPHSYFAPSWDKANTDTSAENIGYVGHLILSKYPIVETDVILQNSDARTNAKGTEDRGVLRAMLNVNGMTVDVFGCQVGGKDQGWTTTATNKGLADIIKASKADTWVVAGNMYFASKGLAAIRTDVGDANVVAACPDRYTFEGKTLWTQTNIIAEGGNTFTGGNFDYTIGTLPAYTTSNNDHMINPIYYGTLTLKTAE